MNYSLLLSAIYGLLLSPMATSAPTAKPVTLRIRSEDFHALQERADNEATALYAYIVADTEIDDKKKRDDEATALYAYIAADSELDRKRDDEATALYAYIAADSELDRKRDDEATALYAYIAADSE
ncbi:uncharacterized protein BO88DRAFT_436354 [Aspergillus vadensis CBS 113365]|uniref:Uncharacterized protein n=1 Tax=Aspergillus vadensis (strain CBS 113365 / IMI 142717 / IBT 24658) TaxID=1448311 RepID=A0A319BQJ8_ASPVC|nr:hypothetical protein BO88DRAFT_436354 [Aspergillus vadensis CBS 113365]PYH68013.1 hypothetical protein BO88DRAFT_436354 [Aspergillus vadensis CBS 113365]